MSSSVGIMKFPIYGKITKCSKPPTSQCSIKRSSTNGGSFLAHAHQSVLVACCCSKSCFKEAVKEGCEHLTESCCHSLFTSSVLDWPNHLSDGVKSCEKNNLDSQKSSCKNHLCNLEPQESSCKDHESTYFLVNSPFSWITSFFPDRPPSCRRSKIFARWRVLRGQAILWGGDGHVLGIFLRSPEWIKK